jgi:hypothetical protein
MLSPVQTRVSYRAANFVLVPQRSQPDPTLNKSNTVLHKHSSQTARAEVRQRECHLVKLAGHNTRSPTAAAHNRPELVSGYSTLRTCHLHPHGHLLAAAEQLLTACCCSTPSSTASAANTPQPNRVTLSSSMTNYRLYLAERLVRRAKIHLLLALCLSRVFLPLACRPQGEQLGLPPAVPPPIGWSTGFMATPRTCRV